MENIAGVTEGKVYKSEDTTAIIVEDGNAYLYDTLQDAVDAAAGQEEVTIQLVKQPEDAAVVPTGLNVILTKLDNTIDLDAVRLLTVAGGSGTADDPYQIADVDQLKDFRDAVNAGNSFADTYFKLTGTEYDLSGEPWIPVGSYSGGKHFSGHFDGAGQTVSGMTIVGTDSAGYLGFFGSLSGAEVKGLTLSGASITCAADCWAGVLAGYAGSSVIADCHTSGTITTGGQAVGSGQTGNHGVAVGGLVEYAYGADISGSSSDVDITISSSDALAYAGGIVCESNGSTLTECNNTGDISAYSTLNGGNSYVGGIAAYIKNGSTISGCENTGAVSSGDATAYYATAGGIVGGIWNETPNAANTVTGSTNSGAVSAAAQDGASYAGGIVGESYQYTQRYENGAWQPLEQTDRGNVTISSCTNSGTVAGDTAAGVLGWGDAEWKLIFTGNSGGSLPQTGYFDLPAEMTFGGEDGDDFSVYANYLTAIQTTHIAGDLPDADLTVEDGQTLIIEAGVTFTGDITLEPGGTLINYGTIEEEAAAPAGEYLVTFKDGDTVLAQVATSGGKVTRLPANPAKSGYTFAGWQLADGTAFTTESTVAGNIDVTVRWNAVSSGGGSSVTRYEVSVPAGVENGKVTVSPSRAAYNQTVTVTVTPDEGYELDALTVAGADGKALILTDKGDGEYTFTMPRGKVSISASFKPVEEPAPAGLPFTDVAESDWYYDAVAYAYENGLMDGTSATIFAPGLTTDRAMLATLLYRLEGRPAVTGGVSFDDVAKGTWYIDAVIWAAAEDIVNGVGDGSSFAPATTITREQMAVMLYRYAQYKGYDVTQGGMAAREYADYDQVSGWAEYAVQWAVNAGLISGTSATTLSPQGSATRAEIATILMRFCETFVTE